MPVVLAYFAVIAHRLERTNLGHDTYCNRISDLLFTRQRAPFFKQRG